MTSHKLAELLLSKEDLPIYHHYWHMDNFEDYGYNYVHKVEILEEEDIILLTTGEYSVEMGNTMDDFDEDE